MINLNHENLKQVTNGFQIPSQPERLHQIQSITQSEEPDINLLADVIAQDIGLSAAILKTINSPCFGMNRSISDIKQAVMFLGFTKVEAITTALLLKTAFKGAACISLERFWDHATDVANAMLHVGQLIKDKVPPETLYTVGLFHDCGIAAMAIKFDDYKETLALGNRTENASVTAIENQRHRTNHAVVGYFIASSWHLPKALCSLILQHHEHDYLQQPNNPLTSNYTYAVLKIAESIVENTRRHQPCYDWSFVHADCLEMLGITKEDYADLEEDYAELYS